MWSPLATTNCVITCTEWSGEWSVLLRPEEIFMSIDHCRFHQGLQAAIERKTTPPAVLTCTRTAKPPRACIELDIHEESDSDMTPDLTNLFS